MLLLWRRRSTRLPAQHPQKNHPHVLQVVEDRLIEDNHKYPYGFYRVGNEIITHKISALIRAGQLNSTPTWHFHANVYSQLNWQMDPPFDLKYYYQKRAQQLREKYEYLVLSFSGGSDSWTVLKSFVDSNTHLDEVYVRWPIKASQGRYTVSGDMDPANILSEWDLTIMPMIHHFQKIMPHTKFTILDWSDELLTREITDYDWLNVQDAINPGVHLKYNSIGTSELDAINSGKKTAIIFGADKPHVAYHQGQVYCYFLDKFANVHPNNSFKRISELFYWTPELPELVLAQARAIFRFLQLNPQTLSLIDWSVPYQTERKNLWDKIVKEIIYKEYASLNTFQSRKPTTPIYDESDDFYRDQKDLKLLQSWKYGFRNILASVQDRFLQKNAAGMVTAFIGFTDGRYCLGSIDHNNSI